LASQVSEVPKEANLAPGGSDSGFQIQVASYREQADADAFVEQLRKRGHRAFRVAASVPDRGEWHRVRVGPFKTKYEAERYKDEFEKTEHIAPFLVDPEQVRRAHDLREAKLRERTKE
jgi:cell division septation protein DedD